MDLSLFYFSSATGGTDGYRLLLDGARFADSNGLSAVWTPERHFHSFGGIFPNPAVTSAAVAAITERIAVRAGSVIAPLHNPLRIAEDWAMIDNLSNGRAGVAFASGWHAQDFIINPGAYADRRESVTATADKVRRLWSGEPATGIDGVGTDIEVIVHPDPIQRDIPIWLTSGGSVETFAAAGKHGYGVLTHLIGQNLTGLAEKIAVYREGLAQCESEQRNASVVVMLHTFLGDDRDTVRELVREPFSVYLLDSFDLIARAVQLAGGAEFSRDIDSLSPDDIASMVDFAFDRYFDSSALFGTIDDAVDMCDQLADIGVDEVACLVDFGVDPALVRDSFGYIADLNKIIQS
ncbi:MupA/Atu3671 family FMN-dependent luciferase-like monooxygenase [Nocardia sp. NPDC056000]|uniref:MupA/Atu3671 family FMN-dependent luciferase-like monooxygenase n=1 Tax=Nocardia sp. NPDC056000 TaxID=3345674 RepID=UPI0035DFE4F5